MCTWHRTDRPKGYRKRRIKMLYDGVLQGYKWERERARARVSERRWSAAGRRRSKKVRGEGAVGAARGSP